MKTLPVGLQLYTVRTEMEKSVPAALKAVKEIGYDYVETAGLYGYSYADFKKELDNAGLKIVSGHITLGDIMNLDAARDLVKGYKSMGAECLALAYLGEESRYGTDKFDAVIDSMDKFGAICEEEGVTFLYHNHDFEFEKVTDGRYCLDYMYDTIPANHLQTELDVCWVNIGGEVPAEYIRKYAGRCPVVHLKDFEGSKSESMYELIGIDKKADTSAENTFKFRPVGTGKQDFPEILEAAVESGAKYVIVEQDQTYDIPCLEAAKISRDNLKKLGW